MTPPTPVRLRPGDEPAFGRVLDEWRRTYGPPEPTLAERLADGRSLLWALFAGDRAVAFVHFRERKDVLLTGPAGGDETARLLAESDEFAVYSFEQLYFCGGAWTLETGVRPILEAVEEELRRTTLRYVLLGHLHSDRPFFTETAGLLEALGWRRRPGDYVTWRLGLPETPPDAGDSTWRFLGDRPPPPAADLVDCYAAVFPDDPPAAVLAADLARGDYGPLSGVAYAGEPPRAAGVVLVRAAGPRALRVERLAVRPEFRRRGLVAAAFLAWARRCRDAGMEALEFQVRASNAPATALVRDRLGARPLKTERFYLRTGEGTPSPDEP